MNRPNIEEKVFCIVVLVLLILLAVEIVPHIKNKHPFTEVTPDGWTNIHYHDYPHTGMKTPEPDTIILVEGYWAKEILKAKGKDTTHIYTIEAHHDYFSIVETWSNKYGYIINFREIIRIPKDSLTKYDW